jgi:hypothetical protein
MNKSDKAVLGAAASPVTGVEVKRLILEAQSAWRTQSALGLCDEPFEAWRHGALYDAVRKTSFRAVGQKEFGLALAHFERLAGKEPDTRWGHANHAIAQRESGPEGDRRRAEYMLRKECETVKDAFRGDPGQALAYALTLLRQIHKTDLPRATAKQIWQVKFTLSNRAKAHAKKAEAAAIAAPVAN